MAMPDFNIDSEDIWGTITDEDIIGTLAQLEAENEARFVKVPAASPGKYVPVMPSKASSERFASLTESDLAKLEMDRHEKKTMDSTAWAVKVIKDWCQTKKIDPGFERLCNQDLNLLLRKFYAEVRKTDGSEYSKSSLTNIRAGIQRHLTSPPFARTINIIKGENFQAANNVFNGSLKNKKRNFQDVTKNYPPISEGDLRKLYSSEVISTKGPVQLQRRVFFSLQYLFCRRGREGNRHLTKDAFQVHIDDEGKEYLQMAYNEHQKNHQGTFREEFQQDKRLYATGDSGCPVTAYKTYIDRLNPKCQWLYQRPKRSVTSDDKIWYDNVAVGHNTLGNMMKAMSVEAGLSKTYTNHSIRATAIVALNKAGIQDRIICSLSGHRNTQSLKSYCSDASAGQKREMTAILSNHGKPAKKPHTVSALPSSAPELPIAATNTRVASPSATVVQHAAAHPQPPTMGIKSVFGIPAKKPHTVSRAPSTATTSRVASSSATYVQHAAAHPPPSTMMINSLLANAVQRGESPVFNFDFAGASVNIFMSK